MIERPSPFYEQLSFRWFLTFGPRLGKVDPGSPPRTLEPFETLRIERQERRGALFGTWFPTTEEVRGGVLLLPPWTPWGRAYFHRRGRIPALRQAGYHVLTLDFPGRGGSGPVAGFFDRDVEDALRTLEERVPGLPLHVWGISAGGYWAHMALSRRNGVLGAMFEDVSPHLIEWGGRLMPAARPGHFVFRNLFSRSYRYFDLRGHAPRLQVARTGYVSGADDPGVHPPDTHELAERAGGTARIIPGAGHLEAIKIAQDEVIGLALETFATAEREARQPLEAESERPGKGAGPYEPVPAPG